MRRPLAFALGAALTGLGCPGERRPPPTADESPPPPADRPGDEAEEEDAAPATPRDRIDRLRARVRALEEDFERDPSRERWEEAMDALGRLEDACFSVLGRGDDVSSEASSAAEAALEDAQVSRDELARQEPSGG